jgi:hypothetical protein
MLARPFSVCASRVRAVVVQRLLQVGQRLLDVGLGHPPVDEPAVEAVEGFLQPADGRGRDAERPGQPGVALQCDLSRGRLAACCRTGRVDPGSGGVARTCGGRCRCDVAREGGLQLVQTDTGLLRGLPDPLEGGGGVTGMAALDHAGERLVEQGGLRPGVIERTIHADDAQDPVAGGVGGVGETVVGDAVEGAAEVAHVVAENLGRLARDLPGSAEVGQRLGEQVHVGVQLVMEERVHQ